MAPETRIVAIGGSLALLVVVIELVRRRRLKEEYALLWVITSLGLLVLSMWYGLLLKITSLIGAVLPSSTLFFSGLIFALLMLLHFSVRVSQLERRVTTLIQEVGLLNVQEQLPDDSEAGEGQDASAPRLASEHP